MRNPACKPIARRLIQFSPPLVLLAACCGCDFVFDLSNQTRARQVCIDQGGLTPADFNSMVFMVSNFRDSGMPRGRARQINCCNAATDVCACASATIDYVYGDDPDFTDNTDCLRHPGAAYDTESTFDERLTELRNAYAGPLCPESGTTIWVAACADDTRLVSTSFRLGGDRATFAATTGEFIAYERGSDFVDALCAGWNYWPTIPRCLDGQIIEVICGDVAVGDPVTTSADCLVDP